MATNERASISKTEKLVQEFTKDNEVLNFISVQGINHKPHPYVIGSKHIGKYTLDLTLPCALKGCSLTYEEHTFDVVAFIQLRRNASNKEVGEILEEVIEKFEGLLDGFIFVDTEEKYRIED